MSNIQFDLYVIKNLFLKQQTQKNSLNFIFIVFEIYLQYLEEKNKCEMSFLEKLLSHVQNHTLSISNDVEMWLTCDVTLLWRKHSIAFHCFTRMMKGQFCLEGTTANSRESMQRSEVSLFGSTNIIYLWFVGWIYKLQQRLKSQNGWKKKKKKKKFVCWNFTSHFLSNCRKALRIFFKNHFAFC